MEKKPHPRWRRLLIAAGLIVFIILGAAWSYGWMRASATVQARFEGWLAAEAKAGRTHECSNRHIGGYPFHIEISCETPLIMLESANGGLSARFSSLKIIALVYSPHLLIAELGSPFTLVQNGKTILSATFKTAQASLRHDGRRFERISLVSDQIVIEAQEHDGPFSAKHAELHLRPSLSQDAETPQWQDFDLAFEADGALSPGSVADQPMDISFSSVIRAWPRWQGMLATTLDEWRHDNGVLEVKDLLVKRNGGQFFVKGDMHFNETHRAEGHFEATFVNSPALLRGLIMQGQNDAGALFGPLLLMLGKPIEFDGQRATSMQVKIENGVLTLGTMVLGEFAPLY
jgi:hypothetical protein